MVGLIWEAVYLEVNPPVSSSSRSVHGGGCRQQSNHRAKRSFHWVTHTCKPLKPVDGRLETPNKTHNSKDIDIFSLERYLSPNEEKDASGTHRVMYALTFHAEKSGENLI